MINKDETRDKVLNLIFTDVEHVTRFVFDTRIATVPDFVLAAHPEFIVIDLFNPQSFWDYEVGKFTLQLSVSISDQAATFLVPFDAVLAVWHLGFTVLLAPKEKPVVGLSKQKFGLIQGKKE